MKRHVGPLATEETGPLFEGWVASVLRAYRDYRGLFEDWFYWAPGRGFKVEVDFLLRRGNEMVAVEVKSGRRVDEGELRGLREVADLPGLQRRLVVYRGERAQRTSDGIEIVPVEAFLRAVERNDLFG